MPKEDRLDDDRYYFHDETGWYHYDETWSDKYGPFSTREIAYAHLVEYCRQLNANR